MLRCPTCRAQCDDLSKHYGHSRACFASEKAPAPRAPPSTAGVEADSQFKMKFARRINLDYANLRYKRFIDTSHLDAFHEHAVSWMDLLFESVLDAVTSATSVVNSKTLKERGGVEWSFCGVNEKGQETVKDSLAAEFRACSFSIKLPNDADPTGDDISHRVELEGCH